MPRHCSKVLITTTLRNVSAVLTMIIYWENSRLLIMLQRQSPAGGDHGAKASVGRHRRRDGSLSEEGMSPGLCVPESIVSVSLHTLSQICPLLLLGPLWAATGTDGGERGRAHVALWEQGWQPSHRGQRWCFFIFSVKTRNPWENQAAPAAELGGCAPCWSPRSWGGSRRRPWRPWGTPGPSHGKWRAGSGEGWGWYGLLQTSHPVQACQVKFSLDSFAKTS